VLLLHTQREVERRKSKREIGSITEAAVSMTKRGVKEKDTKITEKN